MTKDQMRKIFMEHGFTIKEGETDLKDYVYKAAEALAAEAINKMLQTLWADTLCARLPREQEVTVRDILWNRLQTVPHAIPSDGVFGGLTMQVDPSLPPNVMEMRSGTQRIRYDGSTGQFTTVATVPPELVPETVKFCSCGERMGNAYGSGPLCCMDINCSRG